MTQTLPGDLEGRKAELEARYVADTITDAEKLEWAYLVGDNETPDYVKPDMEAAARLYDPTHPKYEAAPPRRRLKLTKASAVRTERIEWLVDCWVPKASVTLLAGREGIGKSTIAVDWAAQATTGQLTGEPMTVGYVVTEDSRSHTVVPRLKAAGANLDRVLFIDADIPDADDPTVRYDGVLDLPQDFPILAETIRDEQIGLLILDAAKSVMSAKLDGNSDTAIRQFLEPMHRTAQDTGCTFIGLAHFGKRETADTGKLILGSSAWSQVARSVVSVAQDREAGTLKVWNSKANLAPRTRTVEAEVVTETITTDDGQTTDVGRIRWGAECEEDGSALLAPDSDHATDDEDEVRMVVFDYLEAHGGNAPANEVLKATRAAGLNDGTVKNKRKKIGVNTRKSGKDWVWSIEPGPGGKVIPFPSRSDHRDLVTFAGQGAKEDHNEGHDQDHSGEGHDQDHSSEIAVNSEDNKITKVTREGGGDDLESAVLAALSPEFPQTLGKVMRTVRERTGDAAHVPGVLDTLAARGAVTVTDGQYTRT